jgi:hypothetical protein
MKKISFSFILLIISAVFFMFSCGKKDPSSPLPDQTATAGAVLTIVWNAAQTQTAEAVQSATRTCSVTESATFTETPTVSATGTITPTFTPTPTYTETPTVTCTFTITPTHTNSPTNTNTMTNSPTLTSTNTPLPKTFGGSGADRGCDIMAAQDGGFVVSGSITNGFPNIDAYIIRVNTSDGNMIWDKIYDGGIGGTRIHTGYAAADGYVFGGSYFGGGMGSNTSSNMLMKTDFAGNTYSAGYMNTSVDIGSPSAHVNTVLSSGSGALIAGSFYDLNTSLDAGGYLARFGAGANDFTFTYGSPSVNESLSSAAELTGGGIIASGYSAAGGGSVYVIKTGSMGAEESGWPKYFAGGISNPNYSNKTTALERPDFSSAIATNTNIMGAGSHDAYFIIMDSSGNCVNSLTCGTSQSDSIGDALVLADGSIVAAGSSNGFIWLIKTTPGLALDWSKTYYAGYALSVCAAPGGGFAVTGFTSAYGAGGDDIFILKTDSSGNRVW